MTTRGNFRTPIEQAAIGGSQSTYEFNVEDYLKSAPDQLPETRFIFTREQLLDFLRDAVVAAERHMIAKLRVTVCRPDKSGKRPNGTVQVEAPAHFRHIPLEKTLEELPKRVRADILKAVKGKRRAAQEEAKK